MTPISGTSLVRIDGDRLLWLVHGNSRAPIAEDVADRLDIEVVDVDGAAAAMVAALPVLADAACLDGLVREAVLEALPAGCDPGIADVAAAAFAGLLGRHRTQ